MMREIVLSWAAWLTATPLSNWLAVHEWVVPVSQSLHIIGIGIVFSCALIISMRLLNVGRRSGRSVTELVGTLTPWMYRALCVLLATGTIQIIAEPVRQFVTPAFWCKMGMIVVVVAMTIWFARTVRREAFAWDMPGRHPVSGRVFAIVSLSLWVAIIFCGRFIGYTWNFYV